MIKITKGAPPRSAEKAFARGKEEVLHLGRFYHTLIELCAKHYAGQPNGTLASDRAEDAATPIQIGVDGRNELTAAYKGKRRRTKLPPYECVEEIVSEIVSQSDTAINFETIAGEQALWRKEIWRQHRLLRIARHELVRRWQEQVSSNPSLGPAVTMWLLNRLPLYYEKHALQAGGLLPDGPNLPVPAWFAPHEVDAWKTPPDIPPGVPRGTFLAYQDLLKQEVESLRGHDPSTALMLWMTGGPTDHPGLDELWRYSMDTLQSRQSAGRPLTAEMTREEFVELSKSRLLVRDEPDLADPAAWRPELERHTVFYVLGLLAACRLLAGKHPSRVVHTRRPIIVIKSKAFKSDFYSDNGIKERLMAVQYGKCAYCEANVPSTGYGDVEHFRPKAGFKQDHSLRRPGYFWLAYSWSNLYFSCQACNQANKGNSFPVLLDDQYQEIRWQYKGGGRLEQSVLVDPGNEDPRDFIRFDPLTGLAYPYDLVRAHLERYCGEQLATYHPGTADPVQEALWHEPRLIPRELHIKPAVEPPAAVTDLAIDQDAFDLTAVEQPHSLRGRRTIQILGLNRADLVTRRIAHLHGLRGLYETAFRTGSPEADDALAALGAATKPQAEFSSLAIDALNTWQREDTHNERYPWLKLYNARLAVPRVYAYRPPESFDDATLMYFLPEDADPNELRFVVSISQNNPFEKLKLPKLALPLSARMPDPEQLPQPPTKKRKRNDGKAEPIAIVTTWSQRGWFLGIPEEDGGLVVDFYRDGERVADDKTHRSFTLEQLWASRKPSAKFALRAYGVIRLTPPTLANPRPPRFSAQIDFSGLVPVLPERPGLPDADQDDPPAAQDEDESVAMES